DVKNQLGDILFVSSPLDFAILTYDSETDQAFANLALDYDFAPRLQGSFKATYAKSDQDLFDRSEKYNRTPPTFSVSVPAKVDYSGLDLTAMLNGTLFALGGGEARFSLGAGNLDEDYSGSTLNSAVGSEIPGRTLGRSTAYAFGELF